MLVYSRGVYGRKYCVATEHPLASYYALKVLEAGGNVFDAALTASSVLAVVQPHLNGIGGDLLGLIREGSSGRIEFINGSGWSPKSLTLEHLESIGLNRVPLHGPLSPTVPGYFEGFQLIYEKYATLDLREILKPAIEIAKEGHVASWGLWSSINKLKRELEKDLGFKELLKSGRKILLKGLAGVLEEISKTTPRNFYESWIAEEITKYLNGIGGVMSLEDLEKYRGETSPPVKIEYLEWEVYECPPNSQGLTTLLLLNLLEELGRKADAPNSIERLENFIKASKIAYHVRNENLGDPRFVKVELGNFTSKSRAREYLETVKPKNVKISPHDTTYFTVADNSGNAVSIVQSLYYPFGSRVLIPKLGIILNNRASYFKREGPDKLEGWKRPLHTLSSIIALHGDSIILLGTSGGDYRPQIHSYILQNLAEYKMSIQEAIGYPRILLSNDKIIVEEGLPTTLKGGLRVEVTPYPGKTGVSQGIVVRDFLVGVSDLRGDGVSLSI